MPVSLSRNTAQKIVNTVKDVCGYDINFINTKGIIFASTDSSRIGTFHEIGKAVISSQETIEVDSDHSFFGTQKGVNIPFIYNQEVIAVIGISGPPEEVRQYAILAQKITYLIIREQELDFMNYGKKNQVNYVIRSLISDSGIKHDYLVSFLSDYHLDLDTKCRTVLIKLDARYNLSNLALIEKQIYQTFEQISRSLYTFNFPDEYILLLPDEKFQKWSYVFHSLAEKYKGILRIGVGNACSLEKQQDSYKSAGTAVNSLFGEQNFACFDDLDLEIILGCVPEREKEKYLQKTISALSKEDLTLLRTYFSTNMSLKDTSELLYLHKNTLQYKLNRIEHLTGFNPRSFRDAVNLFVALNLMN